MTKDVATLRERFQKRNSGLVRIEAGRFVLGQERMTALWGNIRHCRVVRKRFAGQKLVCFSLDGESSHDGVSCEYCSLIDCQPRIRIELASDFRCFQLDLNYSSSRNFLKLLDQIEEQNLSMPDVKIYLTIVERGYWSEVLFSIESPAAE